MKLCPTCAIAYPDPVPLCPRDGAPLPGPPPLQDPLVGAVVGQRYRLLERLGSGRTAAVYRAEHETLHLPVVVKLASPATMAEPAQVERFARQARVGAKVAEGAVRVVDHGTLGDGTCFVVMELRSGLSLSCLLRDGPLPHQRALAVIAALAQTLDQAHRQGFVYADLSAEEVLIQAPPAGPDAVSLIDWGSVHELAELPRWPTDPSELPRCCPPEASPGEPITALADQYQLAALLHQLLTGVLPAPNLTEATLSEAVPAALRAPLARALGAQPETRFPSNTAFVHALQQQLAPAEQGEGSAPGVSEDPPGSEPPLRFCPLCGRDQIDTHSYGSPGTGRCLHCGTIFSVLASPAHLPSL